MSRRYRSKQPTTDDVFQLSTKFLKEHDYFKADIRTGIVTWTQRDAFGEYKDEVSIRTETQGDEGFIEFAYDMHLPDCEPEPLKYCAKLTATPCHYGGRRWWFVCPLSRDGEACGKRVGTLYRAGKYFGCRHCHQLAYKSQNINRRYKSKVLFDVFDTEDEIEVLEESISRPRYNGQPTKKQQKLDRLYQKKRQQYGDFIELQRKKLV